MEEFSFGLSWSLVAAGAKITSSSPAGIAQCFPFRKPFLAVIAGANLIIALWGNTSPPWVLATRAVAIGTLIRVEVSAAQTRRKFLIRAMNRAPKSEVRARRAFLCVINTRMKCIASTTRVLAVARSAGASRVSVMSRFPTAIDADLTLAFRTPTTFTKKVSVC